MRLIVTPASQLERAAQAMFPEKHHACNQVGGPPTGSTLPTVSNLVAGMDAIAFAFLAVHAA